VAVVGVKWGWVTVREGIPTAAMAAAAAVVVLVTVLQLLRPVGMVAGVTALAVARGLWGRGEISGSSSGRRKGNWKVKS
jgi:hypothetical protein